MKLMHSKRIYDACYLPKAKGSDSHAESPGLSHRIPIVGKLLKQREFFMNNYTKRVCLLYRTDTTLPQDKPAMNRQKDICITFAEQHGWHPIREFWESTDDEMGPEKTEDALLELRACAEQKKFDILLVP